MDWEDTKDWEIVPLTKQLDSIVDYRGKTPEKQKKELFSNCKEYKRWENML